MALSRIEVRWAAVAAAVMPRRPGALPGSGPDPDELMQALHALRALQSAAPHTWATTGLTLLMCATYLAQDEAEAVAEGSERLRALGLSDLSVRGAAVRGTDSEGAEYLGKAPSDENGRGLGRENQIRAPADSDVCCAGQLCGGHSNHVRHARC